MVAMREKLDAIMRAVELGHTNVAKDWGPHDDALHQQVRDLEMQEIGDYYCAVEKTLTSQDNCMNWVRQFKPLQTVSMNWDTYSLLSKTRQESYAPINYMDETLMA